MTAKFTGTDKVFEIDTPEKAYSLGFFWGDGNLMRLPRSETRFYPRVEIKKADFEFLYPSFLSLGKGSLHHRKRDRRQEQTVMTICDPNLGWFLFKNDYSVKSNSEPSKILKNISDKLKPYWWRGFVDADGCFYYNQKQYLKQFSLAGSFQNTWTEAELLFKNLDIIKYKKQYRDERLIKNSQSSCIRINNKADITKLGDYLYKDRLEIGLKRKQDIFFRIKE